MFDFIVLSQSKLADAVDTARSKDTTLEEKSNGVWAYLRISSHVVFKRPLLGQTEMKSVQAIHVYHDPQGWLIADIEELAGVNAPVQLRTRPNPSYSVSKTSTTDSLYSSGKAPMGLFPVSPLAPALAGEIDRMRYRLRLKNGLPLDPYCPLGPEQKKVQAESPSSWILENQLPHLNASKHGVAATPLTLSDSLKPFLASNHYLDLDDSLLQTTLAQVLGSETNPTQQAELIYSWVVAHLHFELGAVLFGTSREVLRDLNGDCSEAAILTAALLRRCGVPARLGLGFASVGHGVFIGHAWAEAWLDNQWVGVDAALRQFPAGVERVKLATLDGKDDMRIKATNLMMGILSNLDLEILAAWENGKAVPLKRFPNTAMEGEAFFDQILKGVGDSKAK